MRLKKEPKVHWFEQQTVKKRVKRSVTVVPTDPWFHKQWYMNNDVSPDLNVLSAWGKGYTGLGVVLSILDDGIEKDHPDLSPNYDPLASYDFNSNDPDPQPRYNAWDENRHGTRCAGEVAAVANNRICGAGVAYNAKVGGVRMLDGLITDIVEAQSLSFHPQHIHVYSASWGPEDDGKTVDGPGALATEAFYKGVTNVSTVLAPPTLLALNPTCCWQELGWRWVLALQWEEILQALRSVLLGEHQGRTPCSRSICQGRGGLGSVFIWASGNGGLHHDDCNCDGYTNSIYTLSVGSTSASGQIPWYSEACSSTLTTTYSSGTRSEKQIVTTDLRHRCTDKHSGTSASAPLAAGMIALALEANPALTWRDMQHLVVRASKPAHLQAEDWAVNGVGRKVSHHYGYGLLDAGLLVELAKKWTGTRPQWKCSVKALHTPRNIGSKLTIPVNGSFCSGRTKGIRSLEHVQVQLSLSYSRRGDLAIALTSPMGTTSTLVAVRPYDTSREGYKDWTFMSTHFWDEDPRGTWTLLLENKGDAYNTGVLTSFLLHLRGTDEDMTRRRLVASAASKCVKRDARGACEECGDSFYAYQRSCLSYCPPRYYSRTRGSGVCARCHPSCYTCRGASANNCTACPPAGTFDELSHSCSPPRGSPSRAAPQRAHLPVLVLLSLVCGSPVLLAVPCVTYRAAFCAGCLCWWQMARGGLGRGGQSCSSPG
ncbi:proprotein convertase subtilisin/kexin type 4 isoform X2 [Dromaius novaehollandiae]|uniref:proprotein convertase subtilisin/kexin type 4 isoform X2 n=1 Tax=Dromaius novaehollandiae TaxID=8790 RepID=UPI00312003F5